MLVVPRPTPRGLAALRLEFWLTLPWKLLSISSFFYVNWFDSGVFVFKSYLVNCCRMLKVRFCNWRVQSENRCADWTGENPNSF